MELSVILKGLVIGFVAAAPVGPIGVFCTRRTLLQGRRAGFSSGMGAATADAIYGFVAAFGLTYVSEFLIAHQFWLRLAGGSLLVVAGSRAFVARAVTDRGLPRSARHYAGMYSSTFFLTLTNPMTILSFAAVFAGFGVAGTKGSVLSAGALVLGVFCGSAIWWLFLVGLVSLWRKKLQARELVWVNRIAGTVIAASGIAILLSLAW